MTNSEKQQSADSDFYNLIVEIIDDAAIKIASKVSDSDVPLTFVWPGIDGEWDAVWGRIFRENE